MAANETLWAQVRSLVGPRWNPRIDVVKMRGRDAKAVAGLHGAGFYWIDRQERPGTWHGPYKNQGQALQDCLDTQAMEGVKPGLDPSQAAKDEMIERLCVAVEEWMVGAPDQQDAALVAEARALIGKA